MFLLLHLLTRVAFKFYASYSFIVASCVMDLGVEVKAFREARYRCSSLGCRVRVDLISSKLRVRDLRDSAHGGPREWVVTVWHHCVHVHGNIVSSWAWVHSSGHSPLLVSVG